MINDYVIKLIDNLPDDIKLVTTPKHLDLVLDGGVFNGSYLVGALYFLKEMERRKYIKIDRISGCSIGSIVGFLYFIDGLDLMPQLYDIVNKDFRQSYKLKAVTDLKTHLSNHIPPDICAKVNKRLFISYNNIKKGKKQVKLSYKDVDEIINTIIKSCYIPYLIDGQVLYKNKYMDGINPFIFNKEPNKKILYLDLFGYDKLGNLLNVKNEKSNYHRILSGLLDIHSFFIKQSNTHMCSYVGDWNYINYTANKVKLLLEKLCICITIVLIFIKNKIPDEFKDTIIYKIITKISYDIFIVVLETYCL